MSTISQRSLILALAVLALFAACGIRINPCTGGLPCPNLTATPTPIATPNWPRPTQPEVSTPTTRPTATRTPAATQTPTVEPTAGAVTPSQATSGRAVVELDLSNFAIEPGLDSYAFATLAWTPPGAGPDRYPTTPALQLGLRGTDASPCLAKPCGNRVAIEVRWSSNIKYDRTQTDERAMCGQGTRPAQWIPLGPGPRVQVAVEWAPGHVTVSTPTGSWTATQGAAGPGFGWWTPGIPLNGIGWSYKGDWTAQVHGGSARLMSWQMLAVGDLAPCPAVARSAQKR